MQMVVGATIHTEMKMNDAMLLKVTTLIPLIHCNSAKLRAQKRHKSAYDSINSRLR